MLLEWVAVAASAGILAVTGSWLLRRHDTLGRSRPYPAISAALLTLVAGGSAVPVVLHHRAESRLSGVASDLVGHPVSVRCQSGSAEMLDAGSELGYVAWKEDGTPEQATLIKRAQCGDLGRYRGQARPSAAAVLAVHVLTHEAMHMAGHIPEAEAECAAMQRDARTAQMLGAAPAAATRLARTYWLTVYPEMREEYRSVECRPGGLLDEGLPGAPWSLP